MSDHDELAWTPLQQTQITLKATELLAAGFEDAHLGMKWINKHNPALQAVSLVKAAMAALNIPEFDEVDTSVVMVFNAVLSLLTDKSVVDIEFPSDENVRHSIELGRT